MVISCVFLEQKELIPHPSAFGALENPAIALWHPKQIPNIPRRERQGIAGPRDTEHQKEQNLIGYHGIQSAGKCPGWLLNYGNKLLIGWTLEGSVIRTDIVFLSLMSCRSLWRDKTLVNLYDRSRRTTETTIGLQKGDTFCNLHFSSNFYIPMCIMWVKERQQSWTKISKVKNWLKLPPQSRECFFYLLLQLKVGASLCQMMCSMCRVWQ